MSPETRPARRCPCAHGRRLEPLLDPLVDVPETLLEVHDILSEGLKAKVPRLDDPRVHRADRDLVDTLPRGTDPGVDAGAANQRLRGVEALAQRGRAGRPVLEGDPGPRVGVPGGDDAHQAAHLPLEPERRGVLAVSVGNEGSPAGRPALTITQSFAQR